LFLLCKSLSHKHKMQYFSHFHDLWLLFLFLFCPSNIWQLFPLYLLFFLWNVLFSRRVLLPQLLQFSTEKSLQWGLGWLSLAPAPSLLSLPVIITGLRPRSGYMCISYLFVVWSPNPPPGWPREFKLHEDKYFLLFIAVSLMLGRGPGTLQLTYNYLLNE
jgi:hypothetical protein